MNTVTALGHSRDFRLAEGGKFVALFESSKQEVELQQLHREERLVKVLLALPCSFLSDVCFVVQAVSSDDVYFIVQGAEKLHITADPSMPCLVPSY